MKKFLAAVLASTVLSSSAMASSVCNLYSQGNPVRSLKSTCLVGESASADFSKLNYIGSTYNVNFGQIEVYESKDGKHGILLVDDYIARGGMYESDEKIVPFIMAVVAADLGIISAWVITDMYSK
jgi:hypothetical protein